MNSLLVLPSTRPKILQELNEAFSHRYLVRILHQIKLIKSLGFYSVVEIASRGNDNVMVRGTFANIRIKNEMVPGVEGGMSRYEGEVMPIYDAAMRHKADGTPLVVIAGKEYGTGSSRDWAAKGTNLLGVRAVITESFERIHRSNLVGMGVLPLQFAEGVTRQTLGLTGDETFTIQNVAGIRPRQDVEVIMVRADGTTETFQTRCRIDTVNELEYFLNGGILQYVLRKLAA